MFVHGYGAVPSQGYSAKDGQPEKLSLLLMLIVC